MRFGQENTHVTTNHLGGKAYKLSDKQELVKLALTSFFSNQFHETQGEQLFRLQEYTKTVDPMFLVKLAIFGRDYGLRTINQILVTEAIHKLPSRDIVASAMKAFTRRPDDLLEIVGYYAQKNGQDLRKLKMSNKLKAGVKASLETFDAYKFAKYKNKGEGINLYDLVNMTRAYSPVIDDFMKGKTLDITTWEKTISAEGNNQEAWEKLVGDTKKLPALATIRNLRNILAAGVSTEAVVKHLEMTDWTKIFPFEAMKALDAVDAAGLLKGGIYNVIIQKVRDSFKFITEKYSGKIAVCIDTSGSMYGTTISDMSTLDRARFASYYGAILAETFEDCDLYAWGTSTVKINKSRGEYNMQDIYSTDLGGTDIRQLFDTLKSKGYDNIIVITDEQSYSTPISVAKNQTVIWNIASYEKSLIPHFDKNIVEFTGFTDIMWKLSADLYHLDRLTDEIEKIDLSQ